MKLQVKTAEFLSALQTVARVASTRSAVQALAGIHLVAGDDSVALRASDMEIGLRLTIPAVVNEPGEVVIPARLLLEVVRSSATDTLTATLNSGEGLVELISGSSVFRLRTLRLEDFPRLSYAEAPEVARLDTQAFVDTVTKVARSASRDETRPVLTGILVSVSDQSLRMVATDSYRLCVKSTPLSTTVTTPFEANVPARALQELARIATQSDATQIAVSRTENQIIFTLPDVVLTSRLIDGQFPQYQPLLPETSEHELQINRAELAAVVRRVSLLAQRNTPLALAFSEGEVLISAETSDVGEARETMPVAFTGEPFRIGFNPEFVKDGLESLEDEHVTLKLTGPLRPGVIESADGSGFVYLVMPVRLNT